MSADNNDSAARSRDERRQERRSLVSARPKSLRERQLRKERAMKIVNRYVILAGGMGLVPVALLGQVAVAGLLGRMLYKLCKLYGTPLSGQKTKAVVAAVLGGAHSDWISLYLAKWSDTALPGTQSFTHRLTRPLAGAAITYAIGILFVHHLDTGAWTRKSPRGIPEPRIE